MDSPRVTSCLFRSGASPIVKLQDLKCACLDCYVLNRMSALLPARRGKLYPLRAPKKSFALRSNPVSIFEQVKTETIRYHTLLQTALTYLKELASFDPVCCLGALRCVYPRYVGSVHRYRSSISFCASALLYVANYKLSAPPISQSTSLFLVR